MRRVLPLLTLVLCALLVGCGAAPTPAPFIEPAPLPLRIQMWPGVAVSYIDTRINCHLPADVGDGQFIFGISGIFHSEGPIDRITISRVINMPCTPIHIYCGYAEHGKKPVMVLEDVVPNGECR